MPTANIDANPKANKQCLQCFDVNVRAPCCSPCNSLVCWRQPQNRPHIPQCQYPKVPWSPPSVPSVQWWIVRKRQTVDSPDTYNVKLVSFSFGLLFSLFAKQWELFATKSIRSMECLLNCLCHVCEHNKWGISVSIRLFTGNFNFTTPFGNVICSHSDVNFITTAEQPVMATHSLSTLTRHTHSLCTFYCLCNGQNRCMQNYYNWHISIWPDS